MPTYDDGESFADDDPAHDFFYEVNVDRFRELLAQQFSHIHEIEGAEFDPEVFAKRVQERLPGVISSTGVVLISKDETHQRLQTLLDEVDRPHIRHRVANEILVLLEQITAIERQEV
jgi:hypothetical protein